MIHIPYRQRTARGLQLGMSDSDVVERFATVMGCGTIRKRERVGSRTMWYWQVRRWELLEPLLRRMAPYMGQRRRAAMEALLANPIRTPLTCCPKCGGPLSVMKGEKARRCKPCRRAGLRAAYARRKQRSGLTPEKVDR